MTTREKTESLRIEELDINALKTRQKISIHTSNSVYEFSVTDPDSRTGVLTGGALGEAREIAVLLCSSRGDKQSESRKLCIGTRAVFCALRLRGVDGWSRRRFADCYTPARIDQGHTIL